MPTYECVKCLYSTAHKGRYTEHLLTKKHLANKDKIMEDNVPFVIEIDESKNEYDDLLLKYNALLLKYNALKQKEDDREYKEIMEAPVKHDFNDFINHLEYAAEEYNPVAYNHVIGEGQEDAFTMCHIEDYVREQQPAKIKEWSRSDKYPQYIKDAYEHGMSRAIVHLFRKDVPECVFKVTDKSKKKFSVYTTEWLDAAQSTELLELYIKRASSLINRVDSIIESIKGITGNSCGEAWEKRSVLMGEANVTKKVIQLLCV